MAQLNGRLPLSYRAYRYPHRRGRLTRRWRAPARIASAASFGLLDEVPKVMAGGHPPLDRGGGDSSRRPGVRRSWPVPVAERVPFGSPGASGSPLPSGGSPQPPAQPTPTPPPEPTRKHP